MDIEEKYLVPEPVLFNCIKHHAGYVSMFTGELINDLNTLGNSQMDLYTGNIPPARIAQEVTDYLRERNILQPDAYFSWLKSLKSQYGRISLSDKSEWVLLPGKIPGRHVHIHPARYSLFTIRVRSETIKSAIATLYYCNKYGKDHTDLNTINEARVKLLALSPVREVNPQRGLGKVLSILIDAGRMDITGFRQGAG
jgi:hypothetical protein